ncbi:MAG: protein jag [Acidobacteriaceae bacterium]
MENQIQETVKNQVFELLRHMGFERIDIFERAEEGRVVFNIRTEDAQLLIGKQGATLEALQHIIKALSRKAGMDEFGFGLDVDDYRDKRVVYLKELARKAAHHVRETRKAVSLIPMPAYERKIIHNYLSLFSDIRSESIGNEPNRKLIIRLKPKAKGTKDDFQFIENT